MSSTSKFSVLNSLCSKFTYPGSELCFVHHVPHDHSLVEWDHGKVRFPDVFKKKVNPKQTKQKVVLWYIDRCWIVQVADISYKRRVSYKRRDEGVAFYHCLSSFINFLSVVILSMMSSSPPGLKTQFHTTVISLLNIVLP